MNYTCEFCELHDSLMSSNNLKELFEEVKRGQQAVNEIMGILQSIRCDKAKEDIKSVAGNMGYLKDFQRADHVNFSNGVNVSEHKSTTARYHYRAPTSSIPRISDRESRSDCRRSVQYHFCNSGYQGIDFTELVADVKTVPLGKGKRVERPLTPKRRMKSRDIVSFNVSKGVSHLKKLIGERADIVRLEESSDIDDG